MGFMTAIFQHEGIIPVSKILLNRIVKSEAVFSFFRISFGILSMPTAFLFFALFKLFCISSLVIWEFSWFSAMLGYVHVWDHLMQNQFLNNGTHILGLPFQEPKSGILGATFGRSVPQQGLFIIWTTGYVAVLLLLQIVLLENIWDHNSLEYDKIL